jgi:hypothetical protein
LAEKRVGQTENAKELAPYVSRYKTPQEKVIKELKEMYPGIEVGTVDKVQQETMNGFVDASTKYPVTYIDLTPLQSKPSQVRRYKDGGKVDLRSGIGDIFKVYS